MIPNMIPVMIPIMIPWQTCRSSSSSTQYFLFLSLALNTSTLCIYSGAGRPVNTGFHPHPIGSFVTNSLFMAKKNSAFALVQTIFPIYSVRYSGSVSSPERHISGSCRHTHALIRSLIFQIAQIRFNPIIRALYSFKNLLYSSASLIKSFHLCSLT